MKSLYTNPATYMAAIDNINSWHCLTIEVHCKNQLYKLFFSLKEELLLLSDKVCLYYTISSDYTWHNIYIA